MKAIIPVAGKGIRLLPHTSARQKSLLPVAGRPVLDHILEPLIAAGVDQISMIVGHLGKQVEEHMNGYTDLDTTIVPQLEQKGLGHAVLMGLDDVDEPVLIVLADTIFEADYAKIVGTPGNVLAVVEVDNPSSFGIVQTDSDKIVDMVEKPANPPSNLAIAGIYKIESQRLLKQAIEQLVADDQRTAGEYQLTDALKALLDAGEPFITETISGWYDCGTPEALLATNRYILEKAGESFTHASAATVDSTIRLSTVMEGCEVNRSVVDNSILLPGVKLDKCSISNEIVGAGEKLTGYVSGS